MQSSNKKSILNGAFKVTNTINNMKQATVVFLWPFQINLSHLQHKAKVIKATQTHSYDQTINKHLISAQKHAISKTKSVN
jgi:hypothetical protein